MQLHSPAFEKSLHAAARVELRKSPEKWRQYLWTYLWNPPAKAVCLPLLAVILVMVALIIRFSGTWQPKSAGFAVFPIEARLMTDLLLTCSLLLGGSLWVSLSRLLSAPEQRLPVNHRQMFSDCVSKHRSNVFLLCLAILGSLGLIVGWIFKGKLLWQQALVFSLMHAVNLLSVGMAVSCRSASRPPKPFQQPNPLTGLLGASAFFSPFILTYYLPQLVDDKTLAKWVQPFYAALPGGWTGEQFANSLESGGLTFSVALVPTFLLVSLIPHWHRTLCAKFISLKPDHRFILMPDEVPAECTRAQAEADLRRRLDSPAEWWQAGWVERLVALVLTPKQRKLAELMLPLPPRWSVSLWDITGWIVAMLGIGWFLQSQRSKFCIFPYVMAVGLLVFQGYGLCLFGGRAGAIQCAWMPIHLPVSAWAYTWVWLKIVWVRSLCVMPVYVLAAIFWGNVLKLPPITLALVCLTAWLIGPVLAPQKPLLRVLGAARAGRWWQCGWSLLAAAVVLGTLLLPLAFFSLSIRQEFPRAPYAMAGLGVVLYGLLVLVNWALRKQLFDLAGSGGLIVANNRQGFPVSARNRTPTPMGQVP